jgi:branched-chain amino acid transport system substrate-binding protein
MKRIAGAAMAIAIALGVSVCSAMAQTADGQVKLGVLNDQGGPSSDVQGKGSVVAAQLAIDDFGGQVLGKPIVLISADHQNKVDIGVSIARDWIDQQGVDAIVDIGNSAIALAIQDLIRNRDTIGLYSAAVASSIANEACTKNGILWTLDVYAITQSIGVAIKDTGLASKKWFFIAQDLPYGKEVTEAITPIIEKSGGQVLGTVKHPYGLSDFSSFILQAQSSGAEAIGLANSGGDLVTSFRQIVDFGLPAAGTRVSVFLAQDPEIESIGLDAAQGIYVVSAFYWDLNDATRAFSKRFMEKMGRPPTQYQAGVYGAVTHYLKAVKAAGTDDAKAVRAKMAEMPINDFMTVNGKIRPDGRVQRDMYLFQVKSPAESKGEWDLYKLVRTIPGEKTVRPANESSCPLMKG